MKYFANLLVLVALFSTSGPIFAQSEDVNPDGLSGGVVVADVRLTDVTFTEEDGVITGSFLLTSWLGEQRDIAYGVLAQGPGAQTLDITILERNLVLQEGQVKTVPFSYTIPAHLSGPVEFFVVASTKYGLPLSIQPLVKKSFEPQGETLSCEVSDDRSSVSCVSETETTVTVNYFLGSEFSDSVLNETVRMQPGVVTALRTPTLPGQYVLQVRDKKTAELVQTSVRVPGAYGFIMNSVIDQEPNGISGIITARVSPLLGASVAVSLLGKGNASCGAANVPLEGTSAQFSLTPTCGSGEALIVLKNGEGAALAEERLPFTYAAYVSLEGDALSDGSAPGDSEGRYGLILPVTLLLIIVSILMAIWLKRRNATPTISLVLALFCTFTLAHEVEAVTISASDWGTGGEMSYSVFINVTPDKASYAPGDTMVISGSATVSTDAGADGVTLTDANTAYNKGGTDISWDTNVFGIGGPIVSDVSPLTLSNYSWYGPVVEFGPPETIPALTPGSHYVRLRMNYDTSVTAIKQSYANMSITVTAAPSVDINFR